MHPWYILKSDFSFMVSIFYVRSKRSSCLSQGWKDKIFSFQLLYLRSMILKWHSNLHAIICQVLWLFQYHLSRRLSIPPQNYMLPMKQPLKVCNTEIVRHPFSVSLQCLSVLCQQQRVLATTAPLLDQKSDEVLQLQVMFTTSQNI